MTRLCGAKSEQERLLPRRRQLGASPLSEGVYAIAVYALVFSLYPNQIPISVCAFSTESEPWIKFCSVVFA